MATTSKAARPIVAAPIELSIVVVTHNVLPLLRACLASIYASDFADQCEVFVVDNGTDDSLAMVESEFPRAMPILGSPHIGFAAGNNLALAQARGRYILLLNPDTELPPTALSELHAVMEAHPQWGIVGPKLVRADGSLDLACRRSFPTPWSALMKACGLARRFPKSRLAASYNLTYLDPDACYPIDAVVGAFMFIRRDALAEVGLLDDTFFMYGEDLDLCYRVKQAGWQVWYWPGVAVRHLKGESARQRPGRMTFEFFRSMHVFYAKHQAAHNPAALNVCVIAAIWLFCAAALIRVRTRRDARRAPRLSAL